MQRTCLLLLILVWLSLSQVYPDEWECGGVTIAGTCKCGDENFYFRQGKGCCGPDTCSVDSNGDGVCPVGIVCNSVDTWNCGDLRIGRGKICKCGSVSLEYHWESASGEKKVWCCPYEKCTYNKEDGSAVCPNATVVYGEDRSCNSGVCSSREYLSCKSGYQCVRKLDICHGKLMCNDGSDVHLCSPENEDLCPPDFRWSKCLSDIPHHQECYSPDESGATNNQQYDCVTRGDEVSKIEESIGYKSITACTINGDRTTESGYRCGSECIPIKTWCSPDSTVLSCSVNNKSFTTNNRILCQNRDFWGNFSCDNSWSSTNDWGINKGHRCKGMYQQCVYGDSACSDKSDQVFEVDTVCSEKLGEVKRNQCQDSCAEKEDNCQACSNPNYPRCSINNILHCIHPDLVCDGHAACDDAKDEELTFKCIDKLTKSNAIKPEATVICTSKMYEDKQMKTVAVACNGVVECADGEDEGWLCTNSSIPVYGTLFICVILLLVVIVYKLFKGSFKEIIEESEQLLLPDVLNADIFMRNHGTPQFQETINLFLLYSKVMDTKSVRIAKNRELYKLESKIHGGNVSKIRLCIKNTLEWSNGKILLEDAYPGILRKYFESIDNLMDEVRQWKFTSWLLMKVKTIANIYIDICKDSFIMFTILWIIGGPTSLYFFPMKLTSVVIYCFLATIGLPLFFSSILHTEKNMRNKKHLPFWRKFLAYCYAILISPIRPLLVVEAYEENKSKRKDLIKYNNKKEIVLELHKKERKLRNDFADLIRVDLGLEVVFQLSGGFRKFN